MKKFKILNGLIPLSTLALAMTPAITVCSCANKYDIKLVSELTERQFNDRSNGCTFSFTAPTDNITSTKVKLINLKVDGSEVKSVAGLVKYTCDSAGNIKVVVNTNTLLSQWPDAAKFEFDLQFTNKLTGDTATLGTYTLNYDDSLKVFELEQCDWSLIKERTDAVYAGTLSIDDFVSLFSKDGKACTSVSELIGLEKEITINGVTHTLKVTDVQHDTIADGETYAGKKAVFTFDLANLVSDSDGNIVKSPWNVGNDNSNYLNSTLKANLTGTATWKDGNDNVLPNALTMLTNGSPELKDSIKSVTKEYHYKEDGQWKAGTYNDKLFAPTYYEITGNTCSTSLQEGTRYEYWRINSTQTDRQKKDANGNRFNYWTVSICTGGTTHAWDVWDGSEPLQGSPTSDEFGVSYAFCI